MTCNLCETGGLRPRQHGSNVTPHQSSSCSSLKLRSLKLVQWKRQLVNMTCYYLEFICLNKSDIIVIVTWFWGLTRECSFALPACVLKCALKLQLWKSVNFPQKSIILLNIDPPSVITHASIITHTVEVFGTLIINLHKQMRARTLF